MSLYTDLIDAGIPVANWQSDLYVERTETALTIIKEHGLKYSTFTNKNEGGIWLSIPFQYDPFWSKAQ